MSTYDAGYFEKYLKEAQQQGFSMKNKKAIRDWLHARGKKLRTSGDVLIAGAQKNRLRHNPVIGRMYLFKYEAKTAAQLPYWDAFPLIFPIEKYTDGFLGLNLHYAPPYMRAIIMDRLMAVANNTKFDQTTKLKLNYATLASASKLKPLTPCIKRYLFTHVRSPLMEIYAPEWNIALMMPLARWQKASASTVYSEYGY